MDILNFSKQPNDSVSNIQNYVNKMTEFASQCDHIYLTISINNKEEDCHEEYIQNKQFITLNLHQGQLNIEGLLLLGKALRGLVQTQQLDLKLCNCQIDEQFSKTLASSISRFTNLQTFILDNSKSQGSPKSLSYLIVSMANLKNLTKLNLDFNKCKNMDSNIIKDLAILLQKQIQLSFLEIRIFSWDIKDQEAEYLSKSISKLKNLKDLRMDLCYFGKEGISSLLHSLKKCSNLQVLCIDFRQNKYMCGEMEKLKELLKQLSQLTYLGLTLNGDDDLEDNLVNGIESCQNLTSLYLKLIGFDDQQQLFETISNLPNLIDLQFDIKHSEFDHVEELFNIKNIDGEIALGFGGLYYIQKQFYNNNNQFSLSIHGFFSQFLEYNQDMSQFEHIQKLTLTIEEEEDGESQECVFDFINNFQNIKQLYCDISSYTDEFDENFNWIESTFSQCRNLQHVEIMLYYKLDYIEQRFRNQLIKTQRHLVQLIITIGN